MLLWFVTGSSRLPARARGLLEEVDNAPMFSAASIWEVAIKQSLGREDFRVDAAVLRRGLIDNDFAELAISGAHALEVQHMPRLHGDPFDRLLIAQARVEGLTLLTSDRDISQYEGPIMLV